MRTLASRWQPTARAVVRTNTVARETGTDGFRVLSERNMRADSVEDGQVRTGKVTLVLVGQERMLLMSAVSALMRKSRRSNGHRVRGVSLRILTAVGIALGRVRLFFTDAVRASAGDCGTGAE